MRPDTRWSADQVSSLPRALNGLTGYKLLPLLLVATVLFCHGVYGYSHQLQVDSPASAMSMEGHHSPMDGESSGGHVMTAGNYFAAFLVAFFGAALLLRVWSTGPLPRLAGIPPFERRSQTTFLHPPRGPTTPLLQVFRL